MKATPYLIPSYTYGKIVLLCFIMLIILSKDSCATRDKVMKAKATEGVALIYPVEKETGMEID